MGSSLQFNYHHDEYKMWNNRALSFLKGVLLLCVCLPQLNLKLIVIFNS